MGPQLTQLTTPTHRLMVQIELQYRRSLTVHNGKSAIKSESFNDLTYMAVARGYVRQQKGSIDHEKQFQQQMMTLMYVFTYMHII